MKKVLTNEFKQEVFNFHTDLIKNDKGYGGSIHKRVRERFNLTSEEVSLVFNEMKKLTLN